MELHVSSHVHIPTCRTCSHILYLAYFSCGVIRTGVAHTSQAVLFLAHQPVLCSLIMFVSHFLCLLSFFIQWSLLICSKFFPTKYCFSGRKHNAYMCVMYGLWTWMILVDRPLYANKLPCKSNFNNFASTGSICEL